jgi:hypothetical protein
MPFISCDIARSTRWIEINVTSWLFNLTSPLRSRHWSIRCRSSTFTRWSPSQKNKIPKVYLHDARIENFSLIFLNVSKATLDAQHPGLRGSYDLFAYHSMIVSEQCLSRLIPSNMQKRKFHSYRMPLWRRPIQQLQFRITGSTLEVAIHQRGPPFFGHPHLDLPGQRGVDQIK